MRPPMLAFAFLVLSAPAAIAAPTCQDRNGDTIRCNTPGAMPVGWTPSPEVLLAKKSAAPDDSVQALEAAVVVALFLAMIALLPEFDGTKSTDWARQEGDDD